ncbi:hypothetical protein Tco_1465031 [Tanacetum coccineum]
MPSITSLPLSMVCGVVDQRVMTPFLFNLIPAVAHLEVLLRWLSPFAMSLIIINIRRRGVFGSVAKPNYAVSWISDSTASNIFKENWQVKRYAYVEATREMKRNGGCQYPGFRLKASQIRPGSI